MKSLIPLTLAGLLSSSIALAGPSTTCGELSYAVKTDDRKLMMDSVQIIYKLLYDMDDYYVQNNSQPTFTTLNRSDKENMVRHIVHQCMTDDFASTPIIDFTSKFYTIYHRKITTGY